MTSRSGRGSCRLWASAISALLLSLLAPSSAQASCGDHVHFGPAAESARAKPGHPGPVTPCNGPNCSQRDGEPLSAPVAPPSVQANDSAALVTRPAVEDGDRVERLPSDDLPYSSPALFSIFHPPRLPR